VEPFVSLLHCLTRNPAPCGLPCIYTLQGFGRCSVGHDDPNFASAKGLVHTYCTFVCLVGCPLLLPRLVPRYSRGLPSANLPAGGVASGACRVLTSRRVVWPQLWQVRRSSVCLHSPAKRRTGDHRTPRQNLPALFRKSARRLSFASSASRQSRHCAILCELYAQESSTSPTCRLSLCKFYKRAFSSCFGQLQQPYWLKVPSCLGRKL